MYAMNIICFLINMHVLIMSLCSIINDYRLQSPTKKCKAFEEAQKAEHSYTTGMCPRAPQSSLQGGQEEEALLWQANGYMCFISLKYNKDSEMFKVVILLCSRLADLQYYPQVWSGLPEWWQSCGRIFRGCSHLLLYTQTTEKLTGLPFDQTMINTVYLSLL